MKFLVITVGVSCAPIVTSIKDNKPDKIYFLCSVDTETAKGSYRTVAAKGNVCGKDPKNLDEPNILTLADVAKEGEKYEIIKITDFDDFNGCYRCSLDVLRTIRTEFPDADIIADYTGGTKSMSVGLGAASMYVDGVTICNVRGTRVDLVKVLDGTQHVSLINVNEGFLQRQLELTDNLSERYDYNGVLSVLDKMVGLKNIPPETDKSIQKRRVHSKGFLSWDCFDHTEAWRLLSHYKKYMVDNIKFLEAVIWSRREIDSNFKEEPIEGLSNTPKGHGYEIVEDLLLNSERRASQGRYDDAVGRLYRALELLAQVRLKLEYGIKTGDVDIKKIPQEYREKYKLEKDTNDGKLKIGLEGSYELLAIVNNADPLTKEYLNTKNKFIYLLSVRNSSLFAHGFQPITKEEYDKFHTFFKEFFDGFSTGLDAKRYTERCQFPHRLR